MEANKRSYRGDEGTREHDALALKTKVMDACVLIILFVDILLGILAFLTVNHVGVLD